jgi:hypothetical protein
MSVGLLHRRFRFPGNCNCKELVMRETNGIDEQQAAIASDAAGVRSSIFQELIKLSIVEVDGQPVSQPFVALDTWNSKTRALIIKAYEQLNNLPDDELAAFLVASEDATPGLAAVPDEPVATDKEESASTAG